MYGPAPEISAHAVIGDGRSTALVATDGSIDWLCWPEPASPAVFAALLDDERGGRWSIAPVGPSSVTRGYLDDTNVLVTRFATPTGRVAITDFMAAGDDSVRVGLVPEHLLVRRIHGEAGEVELDVDITPRPEFGMRRARIVDAGPLGIRLETGARIYTLRSDVPLHVGWQRVSGRVLVRGGDTFDLVLAYDESGPCVLPLLGDAVDDALARTIAAWRSWAADVRIGLRWRDAVVRSALTVKLLAYAPSGAIVAASTTSLPERIGGPRNWDYRFCWPRDAAFTTRALWELGHPDDGVAFCSWLLHATRVTLPRVSVLYDVHGRVPARERVLHALAGHRGSRPVRVGNAAADQLQLDVYGEIVDAVAPVALRTREVDRSTRWLLRRLGDFVCDHWREPDQGIWEPRGPPQHYTHSRVLCWVALDRLLHLHAEGLLGRLPVARWEVERAAIRTDVETNGFDARLGSYVQVFGGDTVDAALLLLAWYGFHDASDPRMRGTFELVRRRLEVGPGLYFRNELSRGKGEGAFGICSFWVAEFLARGGGTIDEAEAVFAAALAHENDVGLFGEEIELATGRTLGNFPQAYTHVGLINAALAIERAREGSA